MIFSFNNLNPYKQCIKYKIPLWQCPQFLFTIMGVFIIFSSLVIYFLGQQYINDPRLVALMVIMLSVLLLIIAFIITNSFENLAEANRTKTEFVNIVSHQLRAPLTNLRWAAQFLVSKDFQKTRLDQQEEYFDIIKENSSRMVGLIDDLLIISRLDEGKLNTKKSAFFLKNLTQRILEEYKIFLKAHNIKIDFLCKKKLPKIFANYPLTKIVLENLISNAINYSQGAKEIEIKLEQKKGRIFFSIKDEGIGIPKEDQKLIFKKFFRGKNAIQTEIHGTGLGLYIVKLILDTMDGKIWFKSKADKGATFYFSLPIVKD
jgi:signal transduction histidine kinase